MNCTQIKSEFMLALTKKNWERMDSHIKKSFWPTDCLRPACEIFWMWNNEPETNPSAPETLLMFRAADAFEYHIIQLMAEIGEAVLPTDTEAVKALGLNVVVRDNKIPQFRLEMEREFVPITGYMDGVNRKGEPIEVKTYYSPKVDKQLAQGKPPAEHHLHQLACYIDYLGKLSGLLVSANRSTGNIFFTELRRDSVDSLIFTVGDRSIMEVKPEEISELTDGEEAGIIEDTSLDDAAGNVYQFDLSLEYKRWRKLMENHLIPLREPPLDYEYRPAVTRELLELYLDPDSKSVGAKIKKAIKGERILSDHNWRPQYCHWKDLWAKKEAAQKGFASVDDLCRYTPAEINFMMDFLGVEWRTDKNGTKKLFKRK